MDAFDIAFVKGAIAFVLVAGTGLSTFWVWLRSRAVNSGDFERMLEDVREENARLQAELTARVAELEERVDFAERQMVQQRQEPRLAEPRLPTPV